ncbi:MAG: DUF11 domain-containing protein, partial [Acidimicrobiaceae bacterium]|nr:DUF11 domain-containing protein [Acidimicrobiaceae bacterium]
MYARRRFGAATFALAGLALGFWQPVIAGAAASQTDLAVTETVDNPRPTVGGTVTFTVTLTNNGPLTATGVEVRDLLPAGLALASDTSSEGSYSAGLWTVGTVPATGRETIQIRAKVASSGMQTNTATLAHLDQLDPTPGNDSASASVTSVAPPPPDPATTPTATPTPTPVPIQPAVSGGSGQQCRNGP